ncbi:MAG TPA: cbb3-type cytochrome c oxidase N-terminal domain-containing protein [Phnomibacter sp.]|nr:cbb3-type cytochrome c oxidase N-terminal domain-containing protein [Phnomibacter sp.]
MWFKPSNKKILSIIGALMLISQVASAQPKPPSSMHNPLAQVLVAIMVLLALAIVILGNVVNNAVSVFRERIRKERQDASKGNIVPAVVLLVGAMLFSLTGIAGGTEAAAAAAPVVDNSINGLSPFTFYLMVGVIAIEILILIALVYQLKFLVGIESKRVFKTAEAGVVEKKKENWWWKLNRSTSIEEEADIELGHDYDGISELDNKMPPWWIAAFVITILFSVVYMYRYHVSHSAPLQIEEFEIAMKQAEEEKAANLAKTGGNVDENSVVMLDAVGIASGKTLFTANCTPCHGVAGEGNTVGPNLTDDYWLHGGKINDVFKSVKYGWVEKGMRSWKDDFSPVQIAQLASFIKSLKGSNPPNAKAPQGEKYTEGATAAPAADSTAPAAK